MKATCRELLESVVRDDLDEAGRARTERHLQHCESCAAQARARAAVRGAVLAEDDHLDDLTRTRVLARLGETMDEMAARRAGGKVGARVRWAWGSGIAVAAGVTMLVAWQMPKRPAPAPSKPEIFLEAAQAAQPAAPPREDGRVLTPYAVEGAQMPSKAQLGKARDRVELPANATMRAHLADRADLTLLGPLELAVASASHELVALELVRGTLVADYDGTRGGKLRVRSGDVTVDVVGTLFAVEANANGTRVSVAHGKVRVESQGQVLTLSNGQSWSTGSQKPEPLPRPISLLFQRASHGGADVPAARASEPSPRPQASASAAPPPAVQPAPAVAPAPTPRAPPAPTATAPVTASSLYRAAESAQQRGDTPGGQQLLAELVARFPADPAANAARFELALIFEKAGQLREAFAMTDELVRGRARGPFVEPARRLRCRLAKTALSSHPGTDLASHAEQVMADCAAK